MRLPGAGGLRSGAIRNRCTDLRDRGAVPVRYPFAFIQRRFREPSTLPDRAGTELGRDLAVRTAGRLLARRDQGKAGFLDLSDGQERLQIYVRRDTLGEAGWALSRALDLGDWIGVSGNVFKTRTGELSVKAHELTFLSKCLRPLPEKWHGLKDVERRYRQRYLDLAVNPESRQIFEKPLRSCARFAGSSRRGCLEVETTMSADRGRGSRPSLRDTPQRA